MRWKNSDAGFGLLTKLLHWSSAVLIFSLIALGLYLTNVKIHYTQLYLFGWHKAAGILALSLITLRFLWHRHSRPPRPLGISWQTKLARLVHGSFYLLLAIVPLSGWIASSASGFEISFFGLFPIPLIAPISETIEHRFFLVHWLTTRLLIGLLIAHIGGAVYRHGFKRDGTLRRMWF